MSITPPPKSGMTRVYADRIPLDLMLAAIQQRQVPLDKKVGGRFWSTPPRSQSDGTREILEVRLRDPRLVNYVTLEVARFPQVLSVECYDETSEQWIQVARNVVLTSNPARILEQAPGVHPQHYGPDHWVKFSDRITPVTSARWRVILQRSGGQGPVDVQGRAMEYSLAMRNFDVGYRITSLADFPEQAYDGEPFAYATDLLGSSVEFSLSFMPVDNLSREGVFWQSDPQPFNNAVVPLYLDSRTPDRLGTVLDQFYLNPTTPGALFNLYYSNDDPTPSTRNVAAVGLAVESETTAVSITQEGLDFTGSTSSLEMSNDVVMLDPGQSWWGRMRLETTFPSTEDRLLATMGGWSLALDDSSVLLTSPSGQMVSVEVSFLSEAIITVLFGYDRTAGMSFVEFHDDTGTLRGEAEVSPPVSPITPIVIGPDGADAGGWVLLDMSLHQQDPGDLSGERGKVLDLSPDHRSLTNLLGIIGKAQPDYESMRWIPISRSYVLRKGFIRIPRTKARFWKFEFSNLLSRPYEVFIPIERSVRTFPPDVIQEFEDVQRGGATYPNIDFHTQLASVPRFTEQGTLRESSVPEDRLKATEALYSRDPVQAQKLASLSWQYRLQDWHIGDSIPRFTKVGRHVYDLRPYTHNQSIAFFVGLAEVKGYRTDYSVTDDTEVYRAQFHDGYRLETNTWKFFNSSTQDNPPPEMGGLEAGSGGSIAESSTYFSISPVEGIQFATSQTDPIQVMPDSDFQDFALGLNNWERMDRWHRYGSARLRYLIDSRSISVTRSLDEEGINATIDQGGLESPAVTVRGQRIYAAARVRLTSPLTEPLYLQFTNSAGDVVDEKRLREGGVGLKEWYVGHTAPASLVGPSGIVTDLPHPLLMDSLVEVEEPSPDTTFRVRLIQKELTEDRWVIEEVALFDDPIFWEFSVDGGSNWLPALDIRNNPHGLLRFSEPGTSLRWRVSSTRRGVRVSSLQIRPWYAYQRAGRPYRAEKGGNVSQYDDFPPIEQDPEYSWPKPIPRWWFASHRQMGRGPLGFTRLRSIDGDARTVDHISRNLLISRSFSDSATTNDWIVYRRGGSSIIQPLPHLVGDYGRAPYGFPVTLMDSSGGNYGVFPDRQGSLGVSSISSTAIHLALGVIIDGVDYRISLVDEELVTTREHIRTFDRRISRQEWPGWILHVVDDEIVLASGSIIDADDQAWTLTTVNDGTLDTPLSSTPMGSVREMVLTDAAGVRWYVTTDVDGTLITSTDSISAWPLLMDDIIINTWGMQVDTDGTLITNIPSESNVYMVDSVGNKWQVLVKSDGTLRTIIAYPPSAIRAPEGIILTSPDDSSWRATISTAGALITSLSGPASGDMMQEDIEIQDWDLGILNNGALITTQA